MAGANNPPPKYRSKRGGKWISSRCASISIGICAVAALGCLAAFTASRMGMKVLWSAATDMALEDMKKAVGGFQSFQNQTLQALAIFRRKAYPDFKEAWAEVGEQGRMEHIKAIRERMQTDPLFELVHEGAAGKGEQGGSGGVSEQFAMIAPEFFSVKANFLAFDEGAFEALVRKILVKEENEGFSDAELERLTSMAQKSPEKAQLFMMQAGMRLEMRRLILSRFSLTLAAEVMESAAKRRREREQAAKSEL